VSNQTHTLNPYARYLQQEDPLVVIAATPERLEQLVSSQPDKKLQVKPSPKKWSVRHILCHLADTEIAFAIACAKPLQNPITSFSPTIGTPSQPPTLIVVPEKRSNILFIRSVVPHALTKPVTHPERGP
jgi:hypothetical protein